MNVCVTFLHLSPTLMSSIVNYSISGQRPNRSCGNQVWIPDEKRTYKYSEKHWMTTISFYCEFDIQICSSLGLEVRLYRLVLL